MSLLFHMMFHVVGSGAVAGALIFGLQVQTGIPVPFDISISIIIASFIGGVGVDFDHFFDYWKAYGWKFSFSKFSQGKQFEQSKKIYVPFHSIELAIVLIGISIWLVLNPSFSLLISFMILSFSMSLLTHLLLDLILNEVNWYTYFISVRVYKRFALKQLVPKEHYESHRIKR